jgi:hypothetical protein
LSAAEEALDEHQKRDEAADLLATIERVREQQKRLRERLGAVIAKRTSLENVLAELHRFQVEAEQAMAGMEADKGGDTLDMSVRNFLEFAREAHSRCNGIEGVVAGNPAAGEGIRRGKNTSCAAHRCGERRAQAPASPA